MKPKRDGNRPQIWAEGSQRPRLDPRALLRASLHLGREKAAVPLAWSAQMLRRAAVNIAAGAGRIPEAKLGRAARFVPSHLRVAAWVQNAAATMAHASANADPDASRGNALVAAIEPHLWPLPPLPAAPLPEDAQPSEVQPVILPEPEPDPTLRAIRAELATPQTEAPAPASAPPAPPGPVALGAIQVSGYLIGWGVSLAAFPLGLVLALIRHLKGEDLRKIGIAD